MLLWQVLALMVVFEGVPFFLGPLATRPALRWLIEEISDRHLRLIGAFSMLPGLALSYVPRPSDNVPLRTGGRCTCIVR